jgi:hypothetical protein
MKPHLKKANLINNIKITETEKDDLNPMKRQKLENSSDEILRKCICKVLKKSNANTILQLKLDITKKYLKKNKMDLNINDEIDKLLCITKKDGKFVLDV